MDKSRIRPIYFETDFSFNKGSMCLLPVYTKLNIKQRKYRTAFLAQKVESREKLKQRRGSEKGLKQRKKLRATRKALQDGNKEKDSF